MSGGGRKRRSAEEIAELMAGYERSGLARREYCRGLGIAVTTFDYYRHRWSRSRQLVPVEIGESPASGGGGMTLVLVNGRRIEVTGNFVETALQRLLRVAERT